MAKLTDEQETIAQAESDLMAVTAYAGTGKTSTLQAYARRRPHDRMLYLAFNKALSEEAKVAFQGFQNVMVKTLHALAYSQVGKKYHSKLGNFRVYDLNRYFPELKADKAIGASRVLFELINNWTISAGKDIDGFFKANTRMIGERVKEYGIQRARMAKALRDAWDDMVNGEFTMTHNGYFKLYQLSKPKLEHFTYLLVDEAQDLNQAMLSVILGAKGKKVLVGDPYQQIYGWNGAVNAIGQTLKMGATHYYLTKSFRCPTHVSDIANKYLSLLGAKKEFHGISGPAPPVKPHKCPNIVIGRTNAAIFDFVANNLDNLKIHYNGGFEGYQFEMLKDLNHLRNYRQNRISDPFIKKFKSYAELEAYVSTAQDGVMMVRIEVEKKYKDLVHGIYEKMRDLQAIDESSADLVITTAHKAKGQEYRDVTLLSDFIALEDVLTRVLRSETNPVNYPLPIILSKEEFQLIYVAVTRSFNSLDLPPYYILNDGAIKMFKTYVRQKKIIFE
ncbi:MAG: UvrD-helicase domain-containing protein [Deltaproteobacteria bacterium]|jgi:superfamily I DNA/RNA helicase|nr:UvrD-helicase domain-containing protein [Deltaproteobacteria bacterium]